MTVAASTLAPPFAAMLGDLRGREVAVIGHARPDGDCIGAQVGLARVLRSAGFAVVCVNPDPVPRRLRFLVGDLPFHTSDTVPGDPLAVYVDCADHLRAGEKARRRFPEPVGNIDHHLSNTSFARHNILNTQASAACEMIAGLALGGGLTVDAAAAQALFVGIQTDTGQFRFASTTRETFLLAAELVARGARPAEAGFELYERESRGKLQLLQRFLASLEFACGGRVCIGTLPLGVYGETGTTAEDTEGLVDYARSIDGVDIGVLIEERPDGVKASLRAKEPALRLDQVAAGFNGGGHACAAGLNLKGTAAHGFRARLILALETQLAAAGRPISRNA